MSDTSPAPATNGHGMESDAALEAPGAPVARLCHIVKWAHFDGYGFNLHAEKGKPGQFIGKVDEGSPAEAAGLREGDRIVEVNGVNIANENHKQVVQRIKQVDDETKLLVVDEEADKYFKTHDVVIKSSLPNVVNLKTPPSPAASPAPSSPAVNGQTKSPSSERKNSLRSSESSPEPDQQGSQGDSGRSSANGTLERQNNALNLNMSAAEFRAQLASRKSSKYEVKKESVDFKQKADIIQKL
ncbi:Na(+)/H(+) exchange regulatory cofactor NHE-RF2 [Frankliniella fusca]|uniref:Na(+)/H(+) exchange regulatory cofactor NHE-RF2 n=1 Tax=Frankliniella fusca TaxID=407009 RepID=A0AAE1GXA8_9NEOP|nr:Na(+)/H(+) exchange regulatory cofactor NHE-RF2 [Frankliniella fusca]